MRLVGATAADLTGGLGPLQAPGKTHFLPYLGGERTPLNDAAIRGAFLGLEHATDRAAAPAPCWRRDFSIRDSRDALAATGTRWNGCWLLAADRGLTIGCAPLPPHWISPCICLSRVILAAHLARLVWPLWPQPGWGRSGHPSPHRPHHRPRPQPDRCLDAGHSRHRAAKPPFKR